MCSAYCCSLPTPGLITVDHWSIVITLLPLAVGGDLLHGNPGFFFLFLSFVFLLLLCKHNLFHHDKRQEETAAAHTGHNNKCAFYTACFFSTDGHSWDTESAPSVTQKSFWLGWGPATRLFMSGFLIRQLDVCVALIWVAKLDTDGGSS